MGAELSVKDRSKIKEKTLTPSQKFRAGVYVIIAAMRMSEMEEQWREVRKIGDQVKAGRERARVNANGSKRVRMGVREV